MSKKTATPAVRPKFIEWAKFVEANGFVDFISPEDSFSTELRTQTSWKRPNDSGIYTWITDKGEAYVGQAVHVRMRLRQHWKNYREMAYAAFMPTSTDELDVTEKDKVEALEGRFPILNIKLARSSATPVPFDSIVTAEDRVRFLRGATLSAPETWQEWPLLQLKQSRRFSRFQANKHFGTVVGALRLFVENCIPMPSATEVKFWSVTLLENSPNLLRVNAGQQEVLTLTNDDAPAVRVLTPRPIAFDFDGPYYATNSYCNRIPTDQFLQWLGKPEQLAVRELVVWLMRHTTPLNSGAHCPQVVQAAFKTTRTATSP